MAIKTYPTMAAYSAATKSDIESQVSLIENSREIIVDGINIVTTEPVVGDAIFLDESNNIVFLKGAPWLRKAIIPTAWVHVGYVYMRKGRQVGIIDKNTSDPKYADVVQFKVTIPAESGTLSLGACFVTADTITTISVEYEAGMTLATAENTYEENTTTLCGLINTALAELTLRGTWWAYMNEDDEVIVQRDAWDDNNDYKCSGALTFVTWGDMPAATRYFRANGGWSEYWGIMNIARTRAWATSNGRVPSSMEPVVKSGNDAPVKPSCFEDSTDSAYQYTALIRAEYGTYDNYLRSLKVAIPQKYGTFALPDALTLCATYADLTAPIKAGGTKYKFPAMHAAYSVSYANTSLAAGRWYLPSSEEGCYLLADETLAVLAPTITVMGTTAITNSTYRWMAERYYVNYARLFFGYYGILFNGVVRSGNRVQAVALLNI